MKLHLVATFAWFAVVPLYATTAQTEGQAGGLGAAQLAACIRGAGDLEAAGEVASKGLARVSDLTPRGLLSVLDACRAVERQAAVPADEALAAGPTPEAVEAARSVGLHRQAAAVRRKRLARQGLALIEERLRAKIYGELSPEDLVAGWRLMDQSGLRDEGEGFLIAHLADLASLDPGVVELVARGLRGSPQGGRGAVAERTEALVAEVVDRAADVMAGQRPKHRLSVDEAVALALILADPEESHDFLLARVKANRLRGLDARSLVAVSGLPLYKATAGPVLAQVGRRATADARAAEARKEELLREGAKAVGARGLTTVELYGLLYAMDMDYPYALHELAVEALPNVTDLALRARDFDKLLALYRRPGFSISALKVRQLEKEFRGAFDDRLDDLANGVAAPTSLAAAGDDDGPPAGPAPAEPSPAQIASAAAAPATPSPQPAAGLRGWTSERLVGYLPTEGKLPRAGLEGLAPLAR